MSRPVIGHHIYSAALLAAAGLLGGCGGGGGGSSAVSTPPKVSTEAPYPGTDGTLPGSGGSGNTGGGGGGGGGGGTSGTVVVSGKMTFEYVPTGMISGLQWANATEKPCRNIAVFCTDPTGATIHATTVTDESGKYKINAPKNSTVKIVATASVIEGGTKVLAKVVNATDAAATGPVWAMAKDITTTTTATTANLHGTSGFDRGSNSYTSARVAAPFAINDALYDQYFVMRAKLATLTYPTLDLHWQPNSDEGAFFSPSGNYIFLGDVPGSDTNEYDRTIIAHEWGHFFMFNFSRDDSMGGRHTFPDILDEPTAMSEGLAYGVGMGVVGNSKYIDTYGPGGSEVGGFDIATNINPSSETFRGIKVDGDWSEASCAQILWKAARTPIANDIQPMLKVLTSTTWKNHAGFESMCTFLDLLKAETGVTASAVTNAGTAENIITHDRWHQTAVGRKRYVEVPATGEVIDIDANGNLLQTSLAYNNLAWPSNKYLAWVFLRLKATTAGTYNLKLIPGTSTDGFYIRVPGQGGAAFLNVGTQTVSVTMAANEEAGVGIGVYDGGRPPQYWVNLKASPFTVQFGTPATVPSVPNSPVLGSLQLEFISPFTPPLINSNN